MSITNVSNNILNSIIQLEEPINYFFQDLWFKPEWIFIFLSGVIGAYVAIKMNKIFENKKRIHSKSLIKHSISTTLEAVFTVFFYPVLWAIGILIVIGLIKTGMTYSSTVTLFILLLLGIFYLWRKKKKNKELVKRFKKPAPSKK